MASNDDNGCAGCMGLLVIAAIIKWWHEILMFILFVLGAAVSILLLIAAIPTIAAALWGVGWGVVNYFRALTTEMRLERPWVKGP